MSCSSTNAQQGAGASQWNVAMSRPVSGHRHPAIDSRPRELLAPEIRLGGVHPELIFGIQLHVGHWVDLRFAEAIKLRFRYAEFLEMFAGVGESVVVGVGRTVAPSKRVSFPGSGDRGFKVALVALDFGQDV